MRTVRSQRARTSLKWNKYKCTLWYAITGNTITAWYQWMRIHFGVPQDLGTCVFLQPHQLFLLKDSIIIRAYAGSQLRALCSQYRVATPCGAKKYVWGPFSNTRGHFRTIHSTDLCHDGPVQYNLHRARNILRPMLSRANSFSFLTNVLLTIF